MHHTSFRPRTLTVLLALAVFPAAGANPTDVKKTADISLDDVEVMGKALSTDEKGEAQVYSKNVSNVYIGKEYLGRYRIDSAGDVLKGLNGVYNMNSRTAGSAITPNIRGIAGKGRIPVTIDGTEQTVDVWLNNYGVGDRNYVDPALFRSIAVEKSPAMTRGMKSGVGGAMAIRTIEAEDIIPEGDKWGIELRTSFSGGSTKNKNDLSKYLGWEDYRTLPDGATADGAGGGVDPSGKKSPFALLLDSATPPKQKSGADDFKFGGDQSYLLSTAFKTDLVDGLAAYSYRNKGNYFAGKYGADAYMNNPVYQDPSCKDSGRTYEDCMTSASFVPNMAKMYKPGLEVMNSNTETKTLLLKNNWHLPNNQKIGLQYMKTNILFGEINPFVSTYVLNNYEYNTEFKPPPPQQVTNISSKIQTDTYKIGYEWKPEGNRWLDLAANVWHVRTDSERHQSGGMPLTVNLPDMLYDTWRWCNVRGQPSPQMQSWGGTCEQMRQMYGFTDKTTQKEIIQKSWYQDPDQKKQFRILSGALQTTRATRTGFDISNRLLLRDNLSVTIFADYQREKLDEYSKIVNSDDLFNWSGIVTGITAAKGPRSAKRREWGTTISFDWQPTERLDIQAGVRYHNFHGEDVALTEARKRRDPYYAGNGGYDNYIDGYNLAYKELLSDAEAQDWKKVAEARKKADTSPINSPERKAADEMHQAHGKKWGYNTYHNSDNYQINITHADSRGDGHSDGGIYISNPNSHPYYRSRAIYVPYHNKRLDTSQVEKTFTPGFFDKKVSNIQGLNGTYYKHIITPAQSSNVNALPAGYYESNKLRHTYGMTGSGYTGGAITPRGRYEKDIGGPEYGYILKNYTEEQKWGIPPKLSHHAWAPMLAVTYRLSDNQRVFARYAQMTRFPSLYEIGSSSEGLGRLKHSIKPGFVLKPEHSTNWEAGYGFTFTPYWSRLRHGDVRLTYYSNTIKNVIDTGDDWAIYQYDKKATKGLELQSRIDTGKYFASFGATYRLQQKMCDRQVAFLHDMYLRRAPQCVEGSFGQTRSYQALQPKYSLNLDVGTRLIGEKLELGMRGVYHSKVDNSGYDRLLKQGYGSMFSNFGGRPYYWKSSLVVDAYGHYKINKNFMANFGISNLSNRYYLDPMSSVPVPGPGRTFTVGIKGKF